MTVAVVSRIRGVKMFVVGGVFFGVAVVAVSTYCVFCVNPGIVS